MDKPKKRFIPLGRLIVWNAKVYAYARRWDNKTRKWTDKYIGTVMLTKKGEQFITDEFISDRKGT